MPRKKPVVPAKPDTPRTAAKKRAGRAAVPLTLIEMTFCHYMMKGMDVKEACTALGLGEESGHAFLRRTQVQEYMAGYQDILREKMAEHESQILLKMDVTRDAIAKLYMALAMTPAKETRGNIAGQVQALDSLTALMGYKFDMSKLPSLLAGMSEADLRNAAVN